MQQLQIDRFLVLFFIIIVSANCSDEGNGCPDDGSTGDSDVDTDTDSDVDTDTDTDSDSDMDSDTDTDVCSFCDTDSGGTSSSFF